MIKNTFILLKSRVNFELNPFDVRYIAKNLFSFFYLYIFLKILINYTTLYHLHFIDEFLL